MRSELYEWRPVAGYEGLYEVNNLGEVRRLEGKVLMKDGHIKTVKERILKPSLAGRGYPYVNLSKYGVSHLVSIHRLVAIAFIPNPDNLPQVNHKNENKTDNRVENLEWCTNLYNMTYNDRHIRAGLAERGKVAHNRKEVIQYTLDGQYVASYSSVVECANNLGCSESGIRAVIYGKHKSCKGFKFEYSDGSGKWSDEDIRRQKDRSNENRRNKYIPKKDRVLI